MNNKKDAKSRISAIQKRLARKKLSDEEIGELSQEVSDCFDHMSEVQRVNVFRRFWELGYLKTEIDENANCVYSSSPLMRVFTLSHDHLAKACKNFKGKNISTPEELDAAVNEIKRSVESTILHFRGAVKINDDPELGYSRDEEPAGYFSGFQEGFGSDDYLIGMFFSEPSRARAIAKIVNEWGKFGVRTEPVAEEEIVHQRRVAFWHGKFDRKQFRRQFAKLTHDERLKAIDNLSKKGISLEFTDQKTDEYYKTGDFLYGGESFSRRFSYDFSLGYSKENLPVASVRRQEVDNVERSLFDIIAKHDGFVTMIYRCLENECMKLQESADFLGDGNVYVRFPDETARRRASEEVLSKLNVCGVKFEIEHGEEESIDERIARQHRLYDCLYQMLESRRRSLEDRKQRYRDEPIAIEKEEAELLHSENMFKEVEKEHAERLKKLNRLRDELQ